MRILHTSDWHLGRLFHGASLLDEQARAVARIAELAGDAEVDGGLLLEPLPTGRDEWWDNLENELDSLTDSQLASLAEETTLLEGTTGDGLRDR